ncbi:putative nucleotidyltransferase substrate binding domain-containing protein [Streptomyces sp. NPDC058464]|uniref:putative nucleotidyltransferase substrate binding domain-containing protein n=1 Tax=Streptomyces sp. NPDC058464 TaxID=3346511 RepID=UPI00365746B8
MNARHPADVRALVEFLRLCPPLDTLDEEHLTRAAERATVTSHRTGEVILDAFARPERGLYVVWHGQVSVWTNPDRIRELPAFNLGPTEMFGYVATLLGEAVGPRVAASGDAMVVRLDPDLVDPVFATRHGARLLAREVDMSRRMMVHGSIPTYTLVDDLIVTSPLLVEPTTSIAEAAARMEEKGLPYAAVRQEDGGYGILTDAGIRRAVASASPVTEVVGSAMQTDAPSMRLGASAAEALIAVLESDGDVVLVTDRAGRLRGAIASRDFVVSSTTAGASLHEQIHRAETIDDLKGRYRSVPGMLTGLMARGLAPGRIITVHSAVIDAAVRRTIELVSEQYPDLSTEAFTWLSLGSNGRREALLSSDIDAAASFDNAFDAAGIARYRPMFQKVAEVLEEAGLAHDRHGVSPANPKFARTHADWARAGRDWITAPEVDDAVIMTCLLIDGRPIHGDRGLPEVVRVFGDLRMHPRTMSMLLAASIAQSGRPAPWRRKKVDLKAQFLLPIANIARWAALSVGSTALPTDDRLLAASGSDMLTETDATALADAFDAVQGIRLAWQMEQATAGRAPTDVVRLEHLTPVDRAILAEVTRVVVGSQRRMGNMARFVMPEMRQRPGNMRGDK